MYSLGSRPYYRHMDTAADKLYRASFFSDLSDCDTDGQKQVFACHNFLDFTGDGQTISINIEETMAILTRCSFDESHRQPIFLLGGIPALAELIQVWCYALKMLNVAEKEYFSLLPNSTVAFNEIYVF